jgi:glutathione S-transferase
MVAPIRPTRGGADNPTDGDATMKLYMHPVSTVCRPIRLLCAENGIEIDEETVDLMTGAHHKEDYASLNPNRQVPLLVDGDLKLTEGSAILKYIAEKYQLPSYPADLKKRAKINEVMDWLNTGFYRDEVFTGFAAANKVTEFVRLP